MYKWHEPFSQLIWCRHGFLLLFHFDSDATVGCIPDIKADYVEVKGEFVKVCTAQGTPTLDEVKNYCIDLIEVAIADQPRREGCHDAIRQAETMTGLAHVVCFHLSKWLSYDFLQKVINHFQPALQSVNERLKCYEDQLRPHLLQKVEHIANLVEK